MLYFVNVVFRGRGDVTDVCEVRLVGWMATFFNFDTGYPTASW